MKKVISAFLCFSAIYQVNFAQVEINIPSPQLWLQPEWQNIDSLFFRDHSINGYDAYPLDLGSQPVNSFLNFNPCFLSSATSSTFVSIYDMGQAKKMTVLAVFQVQDTSEETGIWEIKKDTSYYQKLTSQKIQGSSLKVKYRDNNDTTTLVNTYMFSWKESQVDSIEDIFYLGGTDSSAFNGKIAEFIVFPNYLREEDLRKYQSYLCLKYGVTLHKANYISSGGDTLWDKTENQMYRYGIFGIGRDTLLGLNQKQSHSTGMADILTLGAGSISTTNDLNAFTFNNGDYLICGNNGKSLSIEWLDTSQTSGILLRHWLIRPSGSTAEDISSSIRVNLGGILSDSMQCFLVVNHSSLTLQQDSLLEYYLPDSIDEEHVAYFSNLYWDNDLDGKDLFSFYFIKEQPLFAYHTAMNQDLERQSDSLYTSSNDLFNQLQSDLNIRQRVQQEEDQMIPGSIKHSTTYSLYPNPTSGPFHLDISSPEPTWIRLRIIDAGGNIVHSFETYEDHCFQYQGIIHDAGEYFLEITMEREKKAIPLIVK